MKILLVDVDSKMPNLALMKISAYHKERGDQIFLNDGGDPDKVYISCIFTKNRAKAFGIAKMFDCPVEIGGYGANGRQLPKEIEHIMPDYSLYDCDYSMGFTSRGCIRNCPWCIVPQKEGRIRDHAPITEFVHPDHDKLILLDNNFLASPRWKENLQFIIDYGIKVNFNQGLDIRLVNKEIAGALADVNYYNRHFKYRCLHFAFDTLSIEPFVRRGVEILKDAGIKPRELMFYMLTNFNTTFQEDMHRFLVLRELGVDPFVMIYNGNRKDDLSRHFARWVNKRLYKVCEFSDYGRSPQRNVRSLKNNREAQNGEKRASYARSWGTSSTQN